MRVSTGYKVNTKLTRIHVRVLIYNIKPARNGQILTDEFTDLRVQLSSLVICIKIIELLLR